MDEETPRPDKYPEETPRVGPPPTIKGLADDTLRDVPLPAAHRPPQSSRPPTPPAPPPPTLPTSSPLEAESPGEHAAREAPTAGDYGTLGAAPLPRQNPAAPPAVASPPASAPGSTHAAAGDATLQPTDPATRAFQEAALAGAAKAAQAGTAFGKYDLLEPIAKGGMGIVYKARQRGLNRIVAIKMILAGQFADQADIDRFYAEAAPAAALTHPNIVAIHEVGQEQGQHFFSMEYIEGQSLAALVQEDPLTPRRAAEFIITIAETMQFAHDSGIVHRDLKPSNVLLDKKLRPLITDFGLAKQVSNQSQLTMAGSIVGTPSYMSPEQAAGKIDEIGPWSDLYSIGAILYELVTGRPPFRAATPFETIRQVLDTEPVSPRQLNPSVPRDLETICLKCLQKERARRYATTQELADELGRYMRGEPIHARPIGQAARLWRLCKRHPITASAVASTLLMLAMTAVISSLAYIRTSAALAQSELRFRDAMDVVDKLFTRVSEDTLLNQPGMQPLRKDLLHEALSYYQKFLREGAEDPRVQDELGSAYFRVGLITEVLQSPSAALPAYETARHIQQRLLAVRPSDPPRLKALGDTLNRLGSVQVVKKDFDAARKEFAEAVRIRGQLATAQPQVSDYQRVLANTHMNIGLAEMNAGELVKAREHFEEAQKIRERALAGDANNAKLRRDLGQGYYNLGDLARQDGREADMEANLTQAIGIFEKLTAEQPGDLDNQNLLARTYRVRGNLWSVTQKDKARELYQRRIALLEPLARQNPDVVDYQLERASLLFNLSLLESDATNGAAARQALEQAKGILQPLALRFPENARCQRDLGMTLRDLALEQDAAGDAASAASNLQAALRILGELVERFPDNLDYAEQLKSAQDVTLGKPNETPPEEQRPPK
jgi:tetratricopeptide (TPR) repeat protein/predicted Ser/Thr protein kinase